MNIEYDLKLGFKDVMIRPKRSTLVSRAEVEIERCFIFKYAQKNWQGVPIIAANMDSVGTFSMLRLFAQHKLCVAIHKYYSFDAWQEFVAEASDVEFEYLFVSTGTSESDFLQLKKILALDSRINKICVDVANGYSEYFSNFITRVREFYPDYLIVAGNVVTGEMTEQLILCGADVVKVGIGPGSVCTTRLKTGVGYPQLSAIIECSDAAHGLGGRIISDGGCIYPGDIAKACGAGADFVMLGGMLAGHDESEGIPVEKDGQRMLEFYGMSSADAMDKHAGGVAHYRTSEGKKVYIAYRGAVIHTINDILGGLRSACTYVGARQLRELHKRTTFIRVLEQENTIFS